jgi:predicted kinase
MGTGKSTLAAAVAHAFGAELLSTDSLRRSLLGLSNVPADFNEGNYTPTLRRWIYEEMLRRASQLLNDGLSVILDGTFLVRALREQAHQLAQQAHAVSLFVLCTCSRELALSRIEKRAKQNQSDSEARPELYDRQAHGFEEPQSDEPAIAIDTSRDSSEQLATVCRRVHALLFND